jgi:hypothetical protein
VVAGGGLQRPLPNANEMEASSRLEHLRGKEELASSILPGRARNARKSGASVTADLARRFETQRSANRTLRLGRITKMRFVPVI